MKNLAGPATGLYRGWSVVAGGFVCAMLVVGGSVYIFGLFALPFSEEFGLSRANFNNGLILKMVGLAVWSPIMGRLLDRLSARLLIAVGALLYALGMVVIAMSSSLLIISLAILFPISMSYGCQHRGDEMVSTQQRSGNWYPSGSHISRWCDYDAGCRGADRNFWLAYRIGYYWRGCWHSAFARRLVFN